MAGLIGSRSPLILGIRDAGGFPVVWDRRTDQLVTFFFKDRDDLDPSGPTLNELLTEIFGPGYFDDTWAEALRQLRG